MIAPARPPLRRSALARLASGALTLAGVGLLGLTAACDQVPLTAPTGATVTLFSNTTIVPVNGTAEITATVVEAGGTLVQNGTLVNFTTTIGQVDPAEARTRDGKVTVRLVAGGRSGRAIVRAFSGGITSGDLALDIGGAAAGRINLSANPTTVTANQTSTISAVVFDVDGNRLPGVPVSFTTTAGSLGAAVVVSNSLGEATTTLQTRAEAIVTASAGGGSGSTGGSGGTGDDGNGGTGGGASAAAVNATVTIKVAAAPVVTVTASATPTAGTPVAFTIGLTPAATVVESVFVDFGDGSNVTLPNAASVAHTYRNAGTYTVTATVRDANGATGSGSTVIIVNPAAPILIALTPSPQTVAVNAIVVFRVDVTQNPNSVPVQSVSFDFGDGNGRDGGQSLTTSHIYSAAGPYLARATVRFTNGATSTAEAAVRVQ